MIHNYKPVTLPDPILRPRWAVTVMRVAFALRLRRVFLWAVRRVVITRQALGYRISAPLDWGLRDGQYPDRVDWYLPETITMRFL